MSEQTKVTPGQWVCFMRNTQVVYGKVEYVKERKAWQHDPEVVTTAGSVNADAILEVR